MTNTDIGVIVWLGGLFVGESIAFEIRDWLNSKDEMGHFGIGMLLVFWPIAAAAAIAIGALWLASWSVRGPMRLVWWLQDRSTERQLERFERDVAVRSELPKAQVRR